MNTPPAPRIVIRHHRGRDWIARAEGAGHGPAWGMALAALDYRSHAVTDTTPPVFWVDVDAMRQLRCDCIALGVRVELHTRSTAVA